MTRAPSEALQALPDAPRALVRRVLAAADRQGLAVYLVGGPVRDWLLARPVRDVDLLVDAQDGAVETLARQASPEDARVVAHDRFGTVRIEAPDGAEIDLATARSETYPHPGALPVVAPGSLMDDLARRDFSANALAFPLSRTARRRHKDVVAVEKGLADLEARRLRILHRSSFHDDPTRILRAARLAPRLGFSLTRDSRAALRDALRDGAFGRVSGDRLRRELVKLFDDAALGLDPARALRLLDDWHVLSALEPGLALPDEAVAPLRRLGRLVARPAWPISRLRAWQTGLALWLAPQTPGLRRRALRRFGVRGATAERIAGFSRLRDRCLRGLEIARGRGAVDALLRGLREEELVGLHVTAAPRLRRRIVRFAVEDRHRRPPLTGGDLTALGLSGPAVGRVLERVRASFLDGTFSSRDEALTFAAEVASSRQRSPR